MFDFLAVCPVIVGLDLILYFSLRDYLLFLCCILLCGVFRLTKLISYKHENDKFRGRVI